MPQLYEDIFQYRFDKSDSHFANHAIGNLIIAAVSEMREVRMKRFNCFQK